MDFYSAKIVVGQQPPADATFDPRLIVRLPRESGVDIPGYDGTVRGKVAELVEGERRSDGRATNFKNHPHERVIDDVAGCIEGNTADVMHGKIITGQFSGFAQQRHGNTGSLCAIEEKTVRGPFVFCPESNSTMVGTDGGHFSCLQLNDHQILLSDGALEQPSEAEAGGASSALRQGGDR